MASQAPAPSQPSPEPSPGTSAVERPSASSRWQKVRENIKDLVLPFAALAVTAIGGFYTQQFNQRDIDAKAAESRSRIVEQLASGKPEQRDLAAITLSEQGEQAFPTLRVILGTEGDIQDTACQVLRAIAIANPDRPGERRKIIELLRSDIEQGDYVLFQGAAKCVARRDFATAQEGRILVQAIEARLGSKAEWCSTKADSGGLIAAVEAEANFPTGANAPEFLLGVIQNCPDDEFMGARETAIGSLCGVLKKAYPNNIAKLDELNLKIQAIGERPCS